jgi:Calcineurin-like phosphoesterase
MASHERTLIDAAPYTSDCIKHAAKGSYGARIAVIAFVVLLAGSLNAQNLSPAWIELGENGQAIVRIVVASAQSCPTIRINGAGHAMSLREPVPAGFRPACEFKLPSAVKSAKVGAQSLALPTRNPSRVVVIGDTGCRIKSGRFQDCNDPSQWPFERIASHAATENPELVIHVGDYLYRESPCPADSETKCGEIPPGDNWDAWNADFFTPATKLLAAAPWAFSRGNHEDCKRSWRGWFYYLDPRPWTETCQQYSQPYVIKLGAFELAMLDSSAVNEDFAEEKQVSAYAAQLASIHLKNGWLADHHPFWGFKEDSAGQPPAPLSAPLQAAWDRAQPQGIGLILSGHIHLFEYVTMDHGRPIQLVAGDGGTDLAVPIETSLKGIKIHGETVVSSRSKRQFGYTLLTKSGKTWHLSLKNGVREVLVECSVPASKAGCTSPGSD